MGCQYPLHFSLSVPPSVPVKIGKAVDFLMELWITNLVGNCLADKIESWFNTGWQAGT